MSNIEKYENLVLGSGGAGKFIAWTMADAGHRTAMVERRFLGGSCPNVACLPARILFIPPRSSRSRGEAPNSASKPSR